MAAETSAVLAADPSTDPLDGIADTLDHAAMAMVAQMTHGLSPVTILQSFADWWVHLALSPGKQLHLAAKAGRKAMRLAGQAQPGEAVPAIVPLPQDHRFDDPAWNQPPYSLIKQAFLLQQQWWHAATTSVAGVSPHHEDIVTFTVRQMLDMVAPTNFIATNPVLQQRIVDTKGQCLIDGARTLIDDLVRNARGETTAGVDTLRPGAGLAMTRGSVVYRNDLIELIQYAPTTETVRPEPILIVPAWIMKYYILDLSETNSLVRWLVDQGFTVFMISWRNPGSSDRHLNMADYRRNGPMAALDAVAAITGAERIHAAGYCLGGTLLSIAAAAMARDGDNRLASVTLFAAQTDFSEPGELGLFIDDAQINVLDGMMWSKGYLDSGQMGGAFQLLRSNDLIWSHLLKAYLMGEREPITDLSAWNADGTRMPYTMHAQYLRRLFLHNDLANGRYKVDGRAISLSDITCPIFVVATSSDHIAPWRSVHKLHHLTEAEISFVLTNGGHNAGIVSEPGHPHRHYDIAVRPAGGPAHDADEWATHAVRHDGSWWPAWGAWLADHSAIAVPAPDMGAPDAGYPPIMPAPGQYVLEH